MKKINVFVPGKVIIAGEHSVVYGKMALATSIGLGVDVSVSKKGENSTVGTISSDKKGLVRKAIELAGGDSGLNVEISSELPVGSGLGSSAAVCAAVIKGVREYLGKPIDNEELFNLTLECEKIAHGNPSGIDPAIVVYRGLIAYRKGQPFERLKIKTPLELLIVNTGKPAESTKEMVEQVALNPNNLVIAEKIEDLVVKVRENLINGGEIADLLNQNGILLEELGVVGEYTQDLSKELRAQGASVKITGAGGVKAGSGMMIVMGPNLTKIEKLLDNKQVKYFKTIIGEK